MKEKPMLQAVLICWACLIFLVGDRLFDRLMGKPASYFSPMVVVNVVATAGVSILYWFSRPK